jgi:beta-lactamase superfamily II metal-dependent hydrolase
LAAALVLLDVPGGIKKIVFGAPSIPKDFGQAEALDIAFFDVGQGDSSLIGCDGKYILIDTGENDRGYLILRYLDKLKVRKIDIMILTHPHSDHIGGADVIIENMKVGKLYMPDTVAATSSFESVIDAAADKDIGVTIPGVGDVLDLGGMTVTFLHPPQGKEFENMNDVSAVVKIENVYGSALFTGDIESEAENDILSAGFDLGADLLKAAHHGSSTSSSEEFLGAVSPQYAVISCGESNDFGHPHEETLERLQNAGAHSYITYETGNIYFSFRQDGIQIKSEN